jgi:hypothetical protein
MNLLSISFYLYRASLDTNQQPILLVPTKQLEHFLEIINRSLNTSLTIPAGGTNGGFQVTFENNGTPQPCYLGRSTDREMADRLKDNIPPRYYRYVCVFVNSLATALPQRRDFDGSITSRRSPKRSSILGLKTMQH